MWQASEAADPKAEPGHAKAKHSEKHVEINSREATSSSQNASPDHKGRAKGRASSGKGSKPAAVKKAKQADKKTPRAADTTKAAKPLPEGKIRPSKLPLENTALSSGEKGQAASGEQPTAKAPVYKMSYSKFRRESLKKAGNAQQASPRLGLLQDTLDDFVQDSTAKDKALALYVSSQVWYGISNP